MLASVSRALLVIVLGLVGSRALAAPEPSTPNSEVWADFVRTASDEFDEPGRRAAEFLAQRRPDRDADIDPRILTDNLRYALRARAAFPWSGQPDDDLFLNDVLPYASLDETRESWRPEFFEMCSKIVAGCETASEAVQALNRDLFDQIQVHYNTGRKRPNQSPSESIAQGRATCTGLSIILVNACRSVGIPARIVGVASWHDKRGNHTWVEIWDGRWRFVGADEHDPSGLDRAWFVDDASRAIESDPLYAVWATSWQPTGRPFPMVWSPEDRTVHAVNVTRRYVTDVSHVGADPMLHVRLWDRRSGERLAAHVVAIDADAGTIGEFRTRSGSADLNDMPSLMLRPSQSVTLRVEHAGVRRTAVAAAPRSGTQTLDLYWDELALSRDEAESMIESEWAELAAQLARERREELEQKAFTGDSHTLRYQEREFADPPQGGRSLWISLHGGGNAPAEVNDRQWRNQISLYEPEEGIYIAPRAPTNTWNLWHESHVDALLTRLIETYVAARGVDPNRVYLLGYSAGGDGVYQLAPRLADRLAAASMMAGHPNNARPEALRNLPFAILMGADDDAYNRAGVAREWEGKLAALGRDDPGGYTHLVRLYEGLGHWMQRKDAEALGWMARFTREPWPDRVVWAPANVTHARQYWVRIDDPAHRSPVIAEINEQTISVTTEGLSSLTLLLHDRLLDLDKPVTVLVNGVRVHDARVPRTIAAIQDGLRDRADPASCPVAALTVHW